MRPLLATIHLDALRHNLGVVKQHAPQSKIMAVVKADAYGHGLQRVMPGLAQADGYAVLNLSEALVLRSLGIAKTVLLLEGVFSADELEQAASYDITLVVHNRRQIEMLEQTSIPKPVEIFLKMNTGMNRLGFPPTDYAEAFQRFQASGKVRSITLMTHFATADETAGIGEQLACFQSNTRKLSAPASLANSAAILRHPQSHADWVRPGIMLYGASPFQSIVAAQFGLQPAMSLTSEIISVQQLMPGESVGYGQKFTAEHPTRIGVVACGYADGYPRHAPNGTPIAVAGVATRTVGRVSMDMLCVDLTHIPEAGIGSSVELWGKRIPVDAVAEASGTVGYELLCALAPRVPVEVIG